MAYDCRVIRDSVSPDGVRLTTIQWTYPHAVHKDLLRHRDHNSSYLSFRAYPTRKLFQMLDDDPFVPEEFTEYRRGMAVGDRLDEATEAVCREAWLAAKDAAVRAAKRLIDLGVNKGHANILIQDFCWITGIVTATEWENFFALRAFPPENSKPRAEVIKIAGMAYEAMKASKPAPLDYGELHVPLVYAEEGDVWHSDPDTPLQVSAGRCARTSYLTHDGLRAPASDIELHDSLLANRHLSPFDHQAWPIPLSGPKYVTKPDPRVGEVWERGDDWRGNLHGWCGYRKTIPWEYNFAIPRRLKL